MTELSFLLDLLLNQKLPKSAKDIIVQRIKQVEEKVSYDLSQVPVFPSKQIENKTGTYTIREGAIAHIATIPAQFNSIQASPTVIAQTPEAQAAMVSRQNAIQASISGKPEKGQTSPKKW